MTLSRLDAINACLRGIGRAPVATEDDPDLDAAIAGAVVDDITSDLQSQHWYFNKEYNWRLTPNTLGEVQTPNTALSVVPTQENRSQPFSIRNNKLYDMYNHTFNMTDRVCNGVVVVTFLMDLPYEDIPPIARVAVKEAARKKFAQDIEPDQTRWQFQTSDADKAMLLLQKENARQKKNNYFQNNAQAAATIATIGGPNSGAFGNPVFPKRNSSGTL